jgi:hypothetical protein
VVGGVGVHEGGNFQLGHAFPKVHCPGAGDG